MTRVIVCVFFLQSMLNFCWAGRKFINSDDHVPFLVHAEDGQTRIRWSHFDVLRELVHHKYVFIFEKSMLFVGYDEHAYDTNSFQTRSIECSASLGSLCVSADGNRIFPVEGSVLLTDKNRSQGLHPQFLYLYENNCQGVGQGKGKVMDNEIIGYDVSACDINQNSMSIVYVAMDRKLVFRYELISFSVHVLFSVLIIVAFGYILSFYSRQLTRSHEVERTHVDNSTEITASKDFFDEGKAKGDVNSVDYHRIAQLLNASTCILTVGVVEINFNTRNFVTSDDAIGIVILTFMLLLSLIRCGLYVYDCGLYTGGERQCHSTGVLMNSFTDMNVYVCIVSVVVTYGTFDNPLNSPMVFLIFLRVWEKMFKNIHKDMSLLDEITSTCDVLLDSFVASFVLHHVTVQNHYKTILMEMCEIVPLLVGAFVLAKYCTLERLVFIP